jgi:hypothetical protein
MSDETERSVASAGSVAGEPFAWVAWFDDEDTPDADFLFSTKERADEWCCKRGADAVPLYRQPHPMLTAEERRGVTRALQVAEEFHDSRLIATLRGLLERIK